MRVLCPERRGIMRGYSHSEATGLPHLLITASLSLTYRLIYAENESRRADSNRLPLLITSDNSRVAGVCRGLQIPHSWAIFVSPACFVLHCIAFPVVSEWYQVCNGSNMYGKSVAFQSPTGRR